MKKYVLLLTVLLITSYCNGRTILPLSDTLIPTPDTTLRKLVIAAEQSNILKVQVEILEGREILLQKLIVEIENKYAMMENFYKDKIANKDAQIALYTDQVKGYELLVKKERRRRRLATAGGLVTTGAAIFLLLKK